MKIWFLNILMLLIVLALYYFEAFRLIASNGFSIFSYSLLIIVFLIGFLTIGNPFNGKKK